MRWLLAVVLVGCAGLPIGGEEKCGEVKSRTCGDPAVAARFAGCVAAEDEASCVAAGGTWGRIGISTRPGCRCPTGQAGCACDGPEDCLGGCFGTLSADDGCDGVCSGSCAASSPLVGCVCYFEDDQVLAICID